jgi:hypothetical protein
MKMDVANLENPFCLEPVRMPEQFFGREKETRRALGFLHRRQSVSIVGPARIGKTSFLLHVARPDVRAQYRLAEKHIFVYLDGRSLVGCDQGQCYLSILEETLRQVKGDKATGIKLDEALRGTDLQTVYFNLRSLFRTAQVSGLKLIVLLDDLELLSQNHHLEDRFFSVLRSLHTSYQVAYLVASHCPLDTLERIPPEVSPFFNIFQPIALEPLAPGESRELVVGLLKRIGVEFPAFALDRILELGENRPDRLQRAGHVAFRVWQENGGTLAPKHCETIRKQFGKDERHTKRA